MALSTAAPERAPAELLGHPTVRRAALAIAIALAAAFAITIATADGAGTATGRLGGDYPAFYTAGKLIRSDRRTQMYDFAAQEAEQSRYQPLGDDSWLYFPYPPHVAAAYAPLTYLSYKWSYALHTVLMVGALALALHLMRPLLPAVDRHYGICVVGALAFYPMFRSISGGQNTALSLLLVAWSGRAAYQGRLSASGAALGLLLFKPQLALPLIGLHLLARRTRIVVAAAAVGAASWVLSAALLGLGWTSVWWHQVSEFAEIDDRVNRRNAVSLLSLSRAALGSTLPGLVVALAVALALVAIWRRRPAPPLATPMAIAMPALLFISPHALFYDAGLLCVPIAYMLGRGRRMMAAGGIWIAGFTDPAKDVLGFTPIALVIGAVFILILWDLRLEWMS